MADTEFGPDRDDTGGVQLLVAAVVVALDVVHVDGLGDAGDLIEVANPGKLNMASPGSGDWAPYGERAVQAHIRHHLGSRTLSRLGADAERLHRRSGTTRLRRNCLLDRTHQGRSASRAGRGPRGARRGAAGRPGGRRIRAGLRGGRDAGPSARPATRRPRSSTCLTGRSTPASPIPGSGRGLRISATRRSRSRPPNTPSCSRMKPRNGGR
jgi:hypothetical protein